MKRLFFVTILFCFSAAFGQVPNKSDLELNSLPANVTGQWKFHAGDNPAWADTGYNDIAWTPIDPTQYLHALPQVVDAQISWFRLTLNVAPALRGKAVALVINQEGAAAVYFNGVLVRSMGMIGVSGKTEKSYGSNDEPITLQLSAAARQYVAVRYSFDQSLPVLGNGDAVIRASFHQVDSAWDSFFALFENNTIHSWVAGCFMLLTMLQLAIYFLNRKRSISLYLAIYAFLQLVTLTNGVLDPVLPGVTANYVITACFIVAAPLAWLLLLAMAFEIFGFSRDWRFFSSAGLCLAIIATMFITYPMPVAEHVLYIQNISVYIFIISISAQALKQKKSGAKLFLPGIIISFIFFFLYSNITGLWPQPSLLRSVEFAFAFLIPAVLLALLLAREFAQNIFSLEQKLFEVEALSARSLEQEVEKQQILARQNETLEQKVTERTAALNQSLTHLKATQTQLIQSEKMASLGELTAGIAHEIQNPLNFVNNFSDVSVELLAELKEEEEKGNKEDVIAIADDLTQNLEKIRHHGKRADAIVKGMLQHSRATSGQKEPTDLNALADEYLRLAYHGLRAKDKNFNAELITNFDPKLPKANVIAQDIGRVLLNIINNAFYATQQKAKTAGPDYEPTVEVSTTQQNGSVTISVKDNGSGIPDSIKDKIMQPFFTTKPTGEGTGLGLSLSYDIVVKGHGGNMEVNSFEGERSEFIISLPVN